VAEVTEKIEKIDEQTTIKTITVTFSTKDTAGLDHPPVVMSAGQRDKLVFDCEDGSNFDITDIRKATQEDVQQHKISAADLKETPGAPPIPFSPQVPFFGAKLSQWGPAFPSAAGQTYKYTVRAGPVELDPHIIVAK